MGLIDKLKNRKKKLLELEQPKQEVQPVYDVDVIIENHHNIDTFKNEIEDIKSAALQLLELKKVDSFEEGIAFVAVNFRGLKYKRTIKDENGKITVILKDIDFTKDEDINVR